MIKDTQEDLSKICDNPHNFMNFFKIFMWI